MEDDDLRSYGEIQSRLKSIRQRAYEPPFPSATLEWFEEYSITQTLIFYIDLLPYAHYLLGEQPYGRKFTMLDAGCGSGAGANLIGKLHRNTLLRHKIDVTGIDQYDTYKRYADFSFSSMKYAVENVFDLQPNSFDIVLCSHVIEHFTDPTKFIEKLQSVGRLFSLFYCPFEEANLLEGHLLSIQRSFVESLSPTLVEVRGSLGWRHPQDTKSACVVFALPGSDWASLKRESMINWGGNRSALPLFI